MTLTGWWALVQALLTYSTLLLSLLADGTPGWPKDIQEVCQTETYTASCPHGHVIIMVHALYGRMRIGRCVRNSYGFQGCKTDVLSHMDARCSGRQSCEFSVTEIHNHLLKPPCPADFTSYLEVNFTCLHIESPTDAICMPRQPVLMEAGTGFLAKSVTEKTKLGTKECPWRLRARPGQTVNITLINFARELLSNTSTSLAVLHRPKQCFNFVEIQEEHMKQPKSVMQCENGAREVHIYSSTSNQVDLSVSITKKHTYFLIKYQAVGCPDPIFPRASLARRSGERLTVRCNYTTEMWTLTCDGRRWHGHLGNCSKVVPLVLRDPADNFPYGILIVVSIGVALGVFFGGLLLIIASLYLRRKRYTHQSTERPTGESVYNFPENTKNVDTAPSVPYGPRGGGTLGRIPGDAALKEMAYLEQQYQQYGYHGGQPQEFNTVVLPPGHIYESPTQGRRTLTN